MATQKNTPSVLKAIKWFRLFSIAGWGPFSIFFPVYLVERGMSPAQVGIVTSIPVVIGVFTGLMWSSFSDAIGRRKPFLIQSAALTALSTFVVTLLTSFEEVFILSVLRSVLTPPAEGLIVANLLSMSSHRTRATTYSGFAIWGSVGWAAAAGMAGVAVQVFGLKAAMYFATLLFTAALVASFLIPESVIAHNVSSPQSAGPLTKQSFLAQYLFPIKELLTNRQMAIFLLFSLPLALSINAAARFFPIYLDASGASPTMIGLVFTIPALLEVPVFLGVGKWCDRMGRKKPLLIFSAAMYSLIYLLVAFTAHPLILFLIYSALAALAWPSLITGSSTFVAEIVPQGKWVTGQNLLAIWMWSIGGTLGPLMGGFISDTLGLPTMFAFISAFALASALLYRWVKEK